MYKYPKNLYARLVVVRARKRRRSRRGRWNYGVSEEARACLSAPLGNLIRGTTAGGGGGAGGILNPPPMPLSSSAQVGTSLPPRVIGELLGTLTIRLLSTSYHNSQQQDVFARVQFWGETSYSDLCLSKEDGSSPSILSRPVEYPLLGSIHTLCSYLNDASPLKVIFLSQPTNLQQLKERVQPEIVGYAYIQDLCITDFLPPVNIQQEHAQKTTKFSLCRESQIVIRSSGHDRHVGKASFELTFRVLVCHNTALARTTHTESAAQVAPPLPLRQSMILSKTISLPAPNPSHAAIATCASNNDQIISAANDSSRQPSDIGGMSSSKEEKHSLLEELLELCSDDMTIPTVDSSNTCVDPYELWISRMIASASSPATKEFPSLQSAGSDQSHNLLKVTTMKLEVTGVTLSARITNKLCDPENMFVLKYSPPPLAFDSGKAVATTTNSIVCDRLDRQSKVTTMAERNSKSTQVKPPKTGGTPLLTSTYIKQMDVEFKNDDDVRLWLDGIMEFILCYQASESAGQNSKLPCVARLLGKGKETIPNTKPGVTCCVAKASLSLWDVILSETLSVNVKLPLLLEESVHGEAGNKVGTLTLSIALYFADGKKAGVSKTSSSPATALEETQVSMKVRPISPLTSAHHPISVLLSKFVGASDKTDAVAMSQSNAVGVSSPQLGLLESRKSAFSTKQTNDYDAPLQPAKAPSIWLDIRVERMSKLFVDIVKENSGRFKLGMSCSKPQSEIETFGNGPQEIYTLRTNSFDNTNHHDAICLWKVPVDAESNRDKFTTVTLHVWHCENGSSSIQRLAGLVAIPFLLEPVETEEKLCGWLPGIVANSRFDLLDPKTHTSIGTVDVLVAAGLLRQVRALSAVCKSAGILQKWWRRSKTANAVDPHPPSKEVDQQEDYDPEFDTIHAGFVSQDVWFVKGQLREAVSSPDSLFDEWSQQSMSTISGYKSSVRYEQGVISAKLPGGEETQLDAIRMGICKASATSDKDKSLAKGSPQSDDDQDLEFVDCSDCKNLTTAHSCDDKNESTKGNQIEHSQVVMSTLKPMNLENSFAQEQQALQSVGIDPPEEVKQEYRPPPSGKRLSNVSDEQQDNKRCRSKKFTSVPQTMSNHSSTPVNAKETSDESETVNSSGETNECDQSSDTDDAISYRSIGSMIGSLDNINSRLVARGTDPTTKFYASYALENSSDGLGAIESINESKRRNHRVYNPPEKENDVSLLSSRQSKPVCPGRQIEPPEENFVSRTPVAQQTGCGGDPAVQTSEKGTSPMSAPILSNVAVSTSEGIEQPSKKVSDQDSDGLLDVPVDYSESISLSKLSQLPDIQNQNNERKLITLAVTRRLRKSVDHSPLEAFIHHYQISDRKRNSGEGPNHSGIFHCQMGDHVLSPQISTFTRAPNSQKAGQILLEAKQDKTFDKQRLERIFRNT